MAVTHVLHEASSPPEADVWRMWCGHECLALDEGMVPEDTDFYLEREAHKSDCVECLKNFLSKHEPVTRERRPEVVGAE